ncbi:MAG: DUF1772 domain-containing protein [Leptolyngbyaceae cyanobacterium RU_5_1]|nr:DUF1772 domain-containing protein [Leptolyngbyaceae cyanobacterium RU_5_1]
MLSISSFCPVLRIERCTEVPIAFNVPLNDALAVVKSNSTEGAALWANYLKNWTFWNHVRTIASLVAAALFTVMPLK